MIAAALSLAGYGVSVIFTFRELLRDGRPREGRIILSFAVMIALAVVCGGIMTDAPL